MGHNAGWLALGAGIAGGADVILIPEIPYDVRKAAQAILERNRGGKHFSIVVVAEGATPAPGTRIGRLRRRKGEGTPAERARRELVEMGAQHVGNTMRLALELEELTGLESRVTILGYLQRGGTPSAVDRLLATRLGAACAGFINKGVYGVMVAARGDRTAPVPLEQVVGKRKTVPLDHPWVESARRVGTNLGD